MNLHAKHKRKISHLVFTLHSFRASTISSTCEYETLVQEHFLHAEEEEKITWELDISENIMLT